MNIFIGNLSSETTEEEVRQAFSTFGIVTSVLLVDDRYINSGQPRHYGYVQMEDNEKAKMAINNLKGMLLHNRIIQIIEALPLTHFKEGPRRVSKNHFSRKLRERSSWLT